MGKNPDFQLVDICRFSMANSQLRQEVIHRGRSIETIAIYKLQAFNIIES